MIAKQSVFKIGGAPTATVTASFLI